MDFMMQPSDSIGFNWLKIAPATNLKKILVVGYLSQYMKKSMQGFPNAVIDNQEENMASDQEGLGTVMLKDRLAYKMTLAALFSAGSLGDLVSATRHDMLLNRNTLAAIVPNYRLVRLHSIMVPVSVKESISSD